MDKWEAEREAAEERAWQHYNLTRMEREQDYLEWCNVERRDPEDTETMIEYERMWIVERTTVEEPEKMWPELIS